ncbi:MAG: exodeoxyribonuclease VII large subunit [Dehalococcoidia bacterium]|nr:exodeoxyribonuclease VII large subunit [Dehalococcoidia bacterium]
MAVYSVSEVSRYLTEILREDPVLQNVWVRGEVGNLTRSAAGHSYFSLRDADATLRCVMFRGGGVGADLVEEGSAVIAHGRVALYEPRGDLQLIADVVQPEGVGELQLKLEELKVRLEKEGLFEESRKRLLPRFPVRVGVVTSPTGSVWHDIQNVTTRRYPAVELVLAPALVQGNEAVSTIVAAFDALERLDDIDVTIVARGGGSLEDLWPFNEEDVARAIFKSSVPVVSAIGHETDYSIADLVADVRAPTPSAAAELVMPDQAELLADIGVLRRTVSSTITGRLETAQWEVEALLPRLQRGLPDFDTLRLRIDDMMRTTAVHLRGTMQVAGERVNGLCGKLESLSPRDTLLRGYAIVHRESAVVTSPSQVADGDLIGVTVADGDFKAQVTGDGVRPVPRRRRRSRKSTPSEQASMDLFED